jgi:hypothetical protein
MAKLIDLEEQERPLEEKQQPTEDIFAEESQQEETQDQQEDLPDKYKNKSVEDLVRMHQEAEKLLGKQSSEVGELRQVVDSYIQTQLKQQQNAPQQEETVDDVDFFTDPETAVQKAIDNHPKIREAEQVSAQYRKTTALNQLQANHPDMTEIIKDPKFAEWIKASKIRTRLFSEADQNYDYDAADELFSLWKERKAVVNKTADLEKQERKQTVRSASTGGARGSAEKGPRKIYRRQDIINLMRNDPDRYLALSDEITRAYAEKRVK